MLTPVVQFKEFLDATLGVGEQKSPSEFQGQSHSRDLGTKCPRSWWSLGNTHRICDVKCMMHSNVDFCIKFIRTHKTVSHAKNSSISVCETKCVGHSNQRWVIILESTFFISYTFFCFDSSFWMDSTLKLYYAYATRLLLLLLLWRTSVFENTLRTLCFLDFKNMAFYVFFGNDVSKNVKSHKKYQVCWMSIELLASKLLDVMATDRHLSHTVLSCIVSCVHTSDVWCWWPWLTGTDFR